MALEERQNEQNTREVSDRNGGALGIGHACALKLAEEGAVVAVTDVDVNKGSAAVDEIRIRRGDAMFVEHDVANEARWGQVMKPVVETVQEARCFG